MSQNDSFPSGDGTVDHRQYPNETIRLLLERSSCRSFYTRKIPEDVLLTVLEAGRRAATGGNLQPYSIIRIEASDTKERLCRLCENQTFIATAPVNLLFCIDWHRLQRWSELELAPFAATSSFRHFWISFQDTIIAAQNICTAADAVGLGSVYVGTVLECFPELKQMFELPQGVFPVVLLSLGYPKDRPSPRPKLEVDVFTHREKYHIPTDAALLQAYRRKYPSEGIEATAERVAELKRVCLRVHGKEFAQRCLERIEKTGRINIAQRYFGLHYVADEIAGRNEGFLQTMRDFGFDWFQKYDPGTPDDMAG